MVRTKGKRMNWGSLIRVSIFPRRRVVLSLIGVMLVSILFSSSLSFLESFQNMTQTYFGEREDIVIISSEGAETIVTSRTNHYLSYLLSRIDGVLSVSPEVITGITIHGKPTYLRGVTPSFLELQDLTIVEGDVPELSQPAFSLVGTRASKRLDLSVGDRFVAFSALKDAFVELSVSGVFESDSPLDDEVISSLETARQLTDLHPNEVTLIRAKIDKGKLDEEEVHSIIKNPHAFKVKLGVYNSTTPGSNATVSVQDVYGNPIEKRKLEVPGETVFHLSFDIYQIEATYGGETKTSQKILLAQDTGVSLYFGYPVHILNVIVLHEGEGAEGAYVTVKRGDSLVSKGYTDGNGRIDFPLRRGLYTVEVLLWNGRDWFTGAKGLNLTSGESLTFNYEIQPYALGIRVVNAVDGTPIPGARVAVSTTLGEVEAESLTGAGGEATFTLQPGIYNVTVTTGLGSESRRIAFYSDRDVTFSFKPPFKPPETYSLEVHVVWIDGQPLKDAPVKLYSTSLGLTLYNRTDERGVATFANLTRGSYTLESGHLDRVETEQIFLQEDTTLVLRFATRFFHLRVSVENATDNQPIPEAEVLITTVEGLRLLSDSTDDKGELSRLLREGVYNVSVYHRGYLEHRLIELRSDLTLTFSLGPPKPTPTPPPIPKPTPTPTPTYTLSVTVMWTNETPIKGATVMLRNKTTGFTLISDSTDAKGVVIFKGLLEGEYMIIASHLGQEGSDIIYLNEDSEIAILLTTPPTYTLSINVMWANQTPIEGAYVTIELLGSIIRRGDSDISGMVVFEDLLEGYYRVETSYSGQENGTFLYLKGDSEVTILVPLPTFTLTARVIWSNQSTIEGAIVVVENEAGLTLQSRSDAEGLAVFEGLLGGNYRVIAHYTGEENSTGIRLFSDMEVTLRLTVPPPTYTLSVKAVWTNQTSIEGADITVESETFSYTNKSDADGLTLFRGLPEGEYNVTATYYGEANAISLYIDSNREITMWLSPPIAPHAPPTPGEAPPEVSPIPEELRIGYTVKNVLIDVPEGYINRYMIEIYSLTLFSIVSLAALITLMAVLTTGNIVSTSIDETRREIGILRSLGAKRIHVLLVLYSKLIALSLLGGVAGYFIGVGLAAFLAAGGFITLGSHIIQPGLSWGIFLGNIGLAALVTTLGSLRPILIAVSKPPIESLRQIPFGGRLIQATGLLGRFKYGLLACLIPLLVRAVPEILMAPYPTGFDTMSFYIPFIRVWLGEGVSRGVRDAVTISPFFYTIVASLYNVEGVGLTLVFKLLPPLLHGSLGLFSFLYSIRVLRWSPRKALFLSLLSTAYFVPLRVSWDLLRNELGLILLFLSLILLVDAGRGWRNALLASSSMFLVVLTHQLVSLILFSVAIPTSLMSSRRGGGQTSKQLMSSIPPLIAYIYQIRELGLPLTEDVLEASLYNFSSYNELAITVSTFLIYCFIPLSPLIILGLRRLKDPRIRIWSLVCLIASLMPLALPHNSLIFWYRWTLMLHFPLAFFAVEGASSLKWRTVGGLNWRTLVLPLLVVGFAGFLTFGFVVGRCEKPYPYYDIPRFRIYVPSSMLQNTVSLAESPDVVRALEWVNNRAQGESVILTHRFFYGWVSLYSDMSRVLPYRVGEDIGDLPNVLKGDDFRDVEVYMIWWKPGAEWYGYGPLPSGFDLVYRSGNIAVYTYRPTLPT